MTTYPDLGSRSAQLHARALRVLPDGLSRTTIAARPYPLYVRSGVGSKITDVDGNELIDFNNNYTSLLHGHADPGIVEAATRQLALGSAFSFTTEVELRLAELLAGRVASFEQIRFCNSGTEAVMNVIKAARAFTGRPKIAKVEGAYHGSYDYAEVSLDSASESWGALDQPASVAYSAGTPDRVLEDVVVIPFNDADRAVAILSAQAGQLAGVLIDAMPNRVGMVPAMIGQFVAIGTRWRPKRRDVGSKRCSWR